MKKVKTIKHAKVDAPQEFKNEGVEAFQMVDFIIEYFGSKIECTHDTKIMSNGRQYVIGGDGYIKDGYEVA